MPQTPQTPGNPGYTVIYTCPFCAHKQRLRLPARRLKVKITCVQCHEAARTILPGYLDIQEQRQQTPDEGDSIGLHASPSPEERAAEEARAKAEAEARAKAEAEARAKAEAEARAKAEAEARAKAEAEARAKAEAEARAKAEAEAVKKSSAQPPQMPPPLPPDVPPNVPPQTPADNSAREPLYPVGATFKKGRKTEFYCPHCKKHLDYTPKKSGNFAVSCPRCKGKIQVSVAMSDEEKAAAQKNPPQQPPKKPAGEAKTVIMAPGGFDKRIGALYYKPSGLFKSTQQYIVQPGMRYVIGREDFQAPSDISIADDRYISRRSVEIRCTVTERGNQYFLKVLKSTNPVYIYHGNGGVQLSQGEEVVLSFGTRIVMGRRTELTFEMLG